MRAFVLSQGRELLDGRVVDTNAAWLSRALSERGLRVVGHEVVDDELDALVDALRRALGRAELVVCSGGLGSTPDDLTLEAVSRALDLPLEESPELLAWLEERLRRPPRGALRRQARLPRGARAFPNERGTAPALLIERSGRRLWLLPGVPRELRHLAERWLLPSLEGPAPGRRHLLRCAGLRESELAERVEALDLPPELELGYRALGPEVQLSLRCPPDWEPGRCEALLARLREALGGAVFGVDSGPLEEVVGELLRERGQTVSTAESCTGGQLAAAFTRVPGSSAYFVEGAVTYANRAKQRVLGVPPELLERHGAVSEPVARAMAEGMRRRAGTDWALATTGIAGPGGGTPEKPVGRVHLALAGPGGLLRHRRLDLGGDRARIQAWSVGLALDLLRRALEEA